MVRISQEMERVISGEQEKLNEAREANRSLKEQVYELKSVISQKDNEL